MGHADIATTANIYTHASTAAVDQARALLNAAAAPKPPAVSPDPTGSPTGNEDPSS